MVRPKADGPGEGLLAGKAPRLLALDIDDTLTGSDGKLSPANLAAVRRAMDQGILVTLITGRRYRQSAQRFAADIGLAGPIGCHYGRAIVLHPEERFLHQQHLPQDLCRQILAHSRQRDLHISLVADELIFLPAEDEASIDEPRYPLTVWVDDFETVLEQRGDRVMSIGVSGAGAEGVRDVLADAVSVGRATVYSQRVTGQGRTFAVVLGGTHNKGTALLDICSRLGVPPAEVLAMGDSEADIPLLQSAGLGIAMPWADQKVREAADLVASGEANDAAARSIAAVLDAAR